MLPQYQEALARLERIGWKIAVNLQRQKTLDIIERRYAWLPDEIKQFVTQLESAVSPDEKTWLLGAPDFEGTASSAFKWNEWELISLEAAESDASLVIEVTQFWDSHFPVINSVGNGYAYYAIRKGDLKIVRGIEPEFEIATAAAGSFEELLRSIPRLDVE